MRIVPNKFLIVLLGYFIIGMVSSTSYASNIAVDQNPPPPTPPPPGLPIDGGLLILFVLALGLAIYKFTLQQHKKTLN